MGNTLTEKMANQQDWFTYLSSSFSDPLAKTLPGALISVALNALESSLIWGALGSTAGMLTARVVVKISISYDFKSLKEFLLKADEFKKTHSYIFKIALIFAIAIGTLFPIVGFIIAAAATFVIGIGIDLEQMKALSYQGLIHSIV